MRLHLEELSPGPADRRITALGVAGFTVTTQLPPERQVDWRRLGEQLLNVLAEKKTGLLFTVDEIHSADRTELSQLAADVQHFIRDGLPPIGLIFAGLPAAVSDLLDEGVATFLRRAERIDLHPRPSTKLNAPTRTFRQAEIRIHKDQVRRAAEATGGYPFLIQRVGYQLWRQAEINNLTLEADNITQAIAAASRRHETTVIEAALSTASEKEKDFLRAMAEDDGAVAAGDIGKRLNVKSNVVANYWPGSSPQDSLRPPRTERSISPSQAFANTSAKHGTRSSNPSGTASSSPASKSYRMSIIAASPTEVDVAGADIAAAFNAFDQKTSTTNAGTTTNYAFAGTTNTERITAGNTTFLNGSRGITRQPPAARPPRSSATPTGL